MDGHQGHGSFNNSDVVRGYGWIRPDELEDTRGDTPSSAVGFGGNGGDGTFNPMPIPGAFNPIPGAFNPMPATCNSVPATFTSAPGNLRWVTGSHGSAPEDAVRAGHDLDGGIILAGRAYHEGDLLPAKVTPSHGCAFVAYGGQEHSKVDYEVLVCDNVTWVEDKKGRVPSSAISFGTTNQGEQLYMGRVSHKGTVTPGKVHPAHKVLYIPYGGKELSFREYEVLCFA